MMQRIFLLLLFSSFLLVESCLSQASETRNDNIPVKTGLKIGERAPELAYKTPEGDTLRLSSLRGKIVLIDFWASWCPPCRKENPSLVRNYNEFKDTPFKRGKGFTIYSISCDKTREDWLAAIESDGLSWKNHVSDLKGWEAEATYTYKISAIPANFLIDGEGIILAIDLHGDDLQAKLEALASE